MSTPSVNPSGMTSVDPGWDSTSAFTGKPLTTQERQANDARRVSNQMMLAGLPGGERTVKVNRQICVGGTQRNPRTGPRTFLLKGIAGRPTQDTRDASFIGNTFSSTDAKRQADDACGAAFAGLAHG